MVATLHPRATAAAGRILSEGGNAMDAAVAASFALGVVEPFNSGLGGLTSLIYRRADGQMLAVDGTSNVPGQIRPELFKVTDGSARAGAYGWAAVEGDVNNTGYLSMVVPGSPGALCRAHAKVGRLPLSQVVAPAIELAEAGFAVDWYQALAIAWAQDRLARFESSRKVFFGSSGFPLRSDFLGSRGELLVQTDLAATLRAVARDGHAAFYRGKVGQQLVRALRSEGAVLTLEEFAAYEPREWSAVEGGAYRDHQIVGPPMNTGVPTLLEALGILQEFDIRGMGHNTTASLHVIAEALRRSFVDRFTFLGASDIPPQALFGNQHVRAHAQSIDLERATAQLAARDPRDAIADRRRRPVPSSASDADTTHVSVVDQDRNVAAITSTVGGHFGSAVVAPGTGVLMNNGLMWFDPILENPNSIHPGRRIIVAGAPVVVLKKGTPVMTLGAAGGRKIISAVLQILVNVLDFDLSAQDAVSAPRIHCEGADTFVDERVGTEVIDGLRRLGHQVVVRAEDFGSSWFARPNCIRILPDGSLEAGVYPFARGSAVEI